MRAATPLTHRKVSFRRNTTDRGTAVMLLAGRELPVGRWRGDGERRNE